MQLFQKWLEIPLLVQILWEVGYIQSVLAFLDKYYFPTSAIEFLHEKIYVFISELVQDTAT